MMALKGVEGRDRKPCLLGEGGGSSQLFDRPLYYTKLNFLHPMNRNEGAPTSKH